MQKVIFGLGVACLLVISGSISLVYGQPAAQTGAIEETTEVGRDLFLTIGLDIWPNQWQKTVISGAQATRQYETFFGGNIQAATAYNVAFIPTVTLTYKNLFISGSYMATPEYHFGKSINDAPNLFAPEKSLRVETTQEASRQEADLIMGFVPLVWESRNRDMSGHLGFAMGAKGVFQDYEFKTTLSFPASSVEFPTESSDLDISYYGPIVGILGGAKMSDSFALSGNVFGGYLFVTCDPACNPQAGAPKDSPYVSSKLAMSYAPTRLPNLSLTLGYRVQLIINRTETDSGPGIDVAHGPILGANYRF